MFANLKPAGTAAGAAVFIAVVAAVVAAVIGSWPRRRAPAGAGWCRLVQAGAEAPARCQLNLPAA